MVDSAHGRSRSLWTLGMLAVVGTVVANYAVSVAAMTLFDIPAEFPPLAGPGPVVFFSVIGTVAAMGVFASIASVSGRPIPVFRVVVGAVLVVSFIPDLWLLTDSAADAFPGATAAGVGALMLMHVVAAALIVWAVERGR